MHERFVTILAAAGISLDAVKYCPHCPADKCGCRKPAPGLLLAAKRELGLDPRRSFMIGDKPSDVEAGRRAGCRTVLLAAGGAVIDQADHVASDWEDALDFILGGEA